MKKSFLLLIASAILSVTAMAQPKLCGNVVGGRSWTGSGYTDPYDIYSFSASDPSLQLDCVVQSCDLAGTGGGVVDDNSLYLYSIEEMGEDYVRGSIFRAGLDDYSSSRQGMVSDFYQVPTSLTWDASRAKCYGCFYNQGKDGYEFGVLTELGRSGRIKISNLKERIVALADNDNGTLYGIGLSGTLYHVDEETGATTEVGITGVSPSEKIQSACYDDGVIYWAAQTSDSQSALYKIDPQTATSILVGHFPDGEQFYKFKPAAEDGAPAMVDDVVPHFDGPSLTGTLSFTLPSKTFAGSELEGRLSWTITKEGDTLATGQGLPGEAVTTQEITLTNDYNLLQVFTENAVGRSPVLKTSFFVGPDYPNSVSYGEPQLTVDDNRMATVTWPAVSGSVNNGYFLPEEVTYKLVRMPDTMVVADGLKATVFSEQLPEKEGMVSYYYSIVAQFMGNESYPTETNKAIVGSGYEVPYVENFDEGALDVWTVLDQNSDYCTWWLNSGSVYSQAGYSGGSDDWLISPSIRMQSGKYYTVAFKYWGGLPDYTEYAGNAFEVGFGQGTDPSSFKILGKKENIILAEDKAKVFQAVVGVSKDGHYHFGIHDISPSNAYLIYVDSFTVVEGGTLQNPAPISDFTAKADADGALEVVLSFTAPTLTAEGKPLASIDKIVIKRDENTVVKTFDHPDIGQQYTFTDTKSTGLTDGMHSYSVTSINEKGESHAAEASVKVGINIPGTATDVMAVEQADGIRLTWKGPENDADGSPISPESLTYTITAVKYYTQEYNVVASGISETSFTDTSFDLDTVDQFQVYYLVQTVNRAGSDEGAISNQLIIGRPYTLPLVEGFSPEYERQSKYLWWIDLTQDINTMSFFRFGTGMSSDGDNGCAAFYGTEGAFSNLRSGKINMSDVKKPQMSYDYYLSSDLSMYASLAVEYSTDLVTWTEIDRLDYETLDEPDGEEWRTHDIDLSSLAQLPCVYLRLHAEVADDNSAVLVDNIRIEDGVVDNINNVRKSSVQPSSSTVYSITGQRVAPGNDVQTLRSLKPGVYVIGGRKVVVK